MKKPTCQNQGRSKSLRKRGKRRGKTKRAVQEESSPKMLRVCSIGWGHCLQKMKGDTISHFSGLVPEKGVGVWETPNKRKKGRGGISPNQGKKEKTQPLHDETYLKASPEEERKKKGDWDNTYFGQEESEDKMCKPFGGAWKKRGEPTKRAVDLLEL